MTSAGHHTMLNKKEKYPWDYRVEYFQVATTYPLFQCGPLNRYNSNLPSETPDADSSFQNEIRNNLKAWIVFSFPNALSSDQKICGSYRDFTAYPYQSRYNFGAFNSWVTQPSSSDVASMSSTNTKTFAYLESSGNDIVQYGIEQAPNSWHTNYDASGKKFFIDKVYPIFLFGAGSTSDPQYEVRNVSVGTRFYESGFDFNLSGSLETHLRFVPCMKDNTPYICEMYSKTLIPNSMSGTVSAGPKVADNYEAWES